MNAQPYFHNIQSIIQGHLTRAEESIYVSVAWMTDAVLFDSLCWQARQGVEVALIVCDDDINTSLPFVHLEESNGRVYKVAENLMHNKFCVIDDKVLITGSYNWTYSAAKENKTGQREENILVIEGDKTLASDYTQQFKNIVQKYFGETYRPNAKALDLSKVLKRLDIIRQLLDLEDMEDIPRHIEKLEVYTLPTAITEIIRLIHQKQYPAAIDAIGAYQQEALALTVYIDHETERLKNHIKVLEIELAAIANEIEEAEKRIHDFGIRHNRELGDLVKQILLLRKEKLAKEARQAKESGDEDTHQQKQQAYEKAQQDYTDYSKEYQASKEKKYQPLAPEQQKELKKIHRKAVMRCHPDKVSVRMKKQAEQVFQRLQTAYEENDLETVKSIAEQLENGVAFISNVEELLQNSPDNSNALAERLKSLHQRLKHRKTALLQQLQQIHQYPTYRLIQGIADWDSYFADRRIKLEKELHTLHKKNTIHEGTTEG